MAGVDMSIEGLPELQRAMEGLPAAVSGPALISSIRDAGEIVRASVASKAPRLTGGLARAIIFRATQRGGKPSGVVAPDYRRGGGGSHAHLVEFGTAAHDIPRSKGGIHRHPGSKAEPFFWLGVEAVADVAIDKMERAMGDAAQQYWDSIPGGAE